MKCNECNPCNECNSCDRGCKPATYGCDFDIQIDPFDPTTWLVTTGGMLHKVKVPGNGETDTTLSTNYSNKGLNYKAEKHTDIITGSQLGDIIDLEDLRDVQVDDLAGNCYEFIYSKYGDCGEGCQSPADKWHNFNINSDGAKQDWIQYVRGANAYGCPVYLDMPTNKDQYWFGGWRRNGEHYEFGYFQPEEVDTLPKDGLGNTIVMSIDPTTKKPVYGSLALDCILGNVMANLGTDVYGSFSIIQQTPQFTFSFNKVTGDWKINWSDWKDTAHTHRVGYGEVTGKMNWSVKFNTKNGNITYHIASVDYKKVKWTKDKGISPASHIEFSFSGIKQPGGAETKLVDKKVYDGTANWEVTMNRNIIWNHDATVAPNQKVGPLNFGKIFVNWSLEDDEGYTQVNFHNLLSGWDGAC